MENINNPKVLHVLKSSIYSGAENVVLTIMKNLENEYDFLYLASEGPVRDELEREYIPFVLVQEFNRDSLKRVIHDWHPDVIHAHDFSATVLCASVRGQFRLISHLHYDPPWVKRWNMKTLIYTFCKRKIRKVLTVSEKMYQSMVFSKQLEDRWVAIGNPIDVKRIWRMAEQPFPEEQETECDLIFVGRFVEQKNPQRFIELVAALKQAGWSAIQSWMLGSGELLEECEAMIQRLGLQKNISIKGFQKNPYVYMKRAKVMCITSRWEGFGLVALEANILGIPVLSTRNAGCSEILGDEAEELCDTNEQFVRKLKTLCENPAAYKAWQNRALRRGEQYDDMDKYMAKLSCIYRNEVLN